MLVHWVNLRRACARKLFETRQRGLCLNPVDPGGVAEPLIECQWSSANVSQVRYQLVLSGLDSAGTRR